MQELRVIDPVLTNLDPEFEVNLFIDQIPDFLAGGRADGLDAFPRPADDHGLVRGLRHIDGGMDEQLILVREAHCQGFREDCTRTASSFLKTQELAAYNRFNDALLRLLQHPRVQDKNFQSTDQQLNRYMLALYDLDRFRQLINSGTIILPFPLNKKQQEGLADNDEELLLLAIDWLCRDFFGE